MRIETFLVDAFTTKPYHGNPAAVCLVPYPSGSSSCPIPDDELQRIAFELGFSETTFVFLPVEDTTGGESSLQQDAANAAASAAAADSATSTVARSSKKHEAHFWIRWFSPQREIGLCGHATLSAAHILFDELPKTVDYRRPISADKLRFVLPEDVAKVVFHSSKAGVLPVSRQTAGAYDLDFPARFPGPLNIVSKDKQNASGESSQPKSIAVEAAAALLKALGLNAADAEELRLHEGSQKYLVVLRSSEHVVHAKPNMQKLAEVFMQHTWPVEPLSVTITAASYDASAESIAALKLPPEVLECDCISRHFAPWVGIPEDPVTGAAHVVLAPYWCNRRKKRSVYGYQASSRGGFVRCTLSDNDARIVLEGHAVTVLNGHVALKLPQPQTVAISSL